MTDIQANIASIRDTIAAGPYRSTWESLENIGIPKWYEDAKFGIFVHWGPYAVPAFDSEWYPRNMYIEGHKAYEHHLKTYGQHAKFGYKDFIPLFKAEKYNPAAWAKLFAASGAKFVVPVAEHHDGFAMYDTKLSKWNARRMGPKKDVFAALAAAVRKEGMTLGLSNHRIEHWWFFNGGQKFDSDVKTGKFTDLYGPAAPEHSPPSKEFMEDWLARCCELVDLFHPQVFWFDWWIEQPLMKPYLREFAAYYYNRGVEWGIPVSINYKNDAYTPKSAVLDLERGQLSDIRSMFWQNDTSVAKNSWCFTENNEYKTSTSIIGDLVDVVSKNGALLLNIGPRADGTIPAEDERILLDIGKWLAVNGEAIYGTRPWKVFGEGPTQVTEGMFTDTLRSDFTDGDFRFTSRGQKTIYAIGFATRDGDVLIRSFGSHLRLLTTEIKAVELLGHRGKLEWSKSPQGLQLRLPQRLPSSHAFAVKVSCE